MNIQQFHIEELELHISYVKEVVQCILHTIIFTRAFGLVRPVETSIDFLDFFYVRCDDEGIEKKVDEKTEEFVHSFAKRKVNKMQIVLSFNEKRAKSNFFSKYDLVCWEQWIINISLSNKEVDKGKINTALAKELEKRVVYVLKLVNENIGHIPPITNKDITPFPFEITLPNSNSEGGVVDMFWNILKSPPTLLT